MPRTFIDIVPVCLFCMAYGVALTEPGSCSATEPPEVPGPSASTPQGSREPPATVDSERDEVTGSLHRVRRNVVYSEPDGKKLRADLYVPLAEGRFPGVVLIHGGGWRAGSKAHMLVHAKRLADRGYVAMAINYRLAPKFQFPAQIYDCKAAVRWLREHAEEYRVDPERVAAYGYSAGGHLACLLGTTDPEDGLEGIEDAHLAVSTRVQAVVAGGAPCDFQTMPPDAHVLSYWLGGSRSEKPGVYRTASPIVWATADDPPMFFYNGDQDWLVPSFIPARMHQRLLQLGVPSEFHICAKKSHGNAFLNREAMSHIASFLDGVFKADSLVGRETASQSLDPGGSSVMLEREEHVEQAYFFRSLRERLELNLPLQELLANIREEILASTKLPMAIDFLLSELLLEGVLGPAMARLKHYFTAFQTYVITEAERDEGRFDMRVGLEILEREAKYRGESATPEGIFLYQFETICRNRLRYDPGLTATAEDPVFDDDWREWLRMVRTQVGIVDLADLIYLRSQHHVLRQKQRGLEEEQDSYVVLFGEKEGKIALANRRKEPLLLLSALQRHLGYPAVPRPQPIQENPDLIPQLSRRIERLETRIKLMEEEQRDGGIDITRFYGDK